MWFLLTQIFPLLLLAAVLGAVLAYWWLKNRQEDVTESYERLSEKLEALSTRPEPAAREDYEAGMALISSAVRSLRMPDMEPVTQRLSSVEVAISGFTVPETDLSPVQGKLDAVEASLSGLDDRLSRLDGRLSDLDSTLSSVAGAVTGLNNTDLSPLEVRFGKIEESLAAIKVPDVDLGPLHSGLARLDLTIAGLDRPQTDLGPVQARLSEFESRIEIGRAHV